MVWGVFFSVLFAAGAAILFLRGGERILLLILLASSAGTTLLFVKGLVLVLAVLFVFLWAMFFSLARKAFESAAEGEANEPLRFGALLSLGLSLFAGTAVFQQGYLAFPYSLLEIFLLSFLHLSLILSFGGIRRSANAFFFALLLAEAFWVFSFLPFSPLTTAGLLLIMAYATSELLRTENPRILLFAGALGGVLLLTTQWLLQR
ncbi:hypothetical protein HYW30_01380 [Candidatus Azambacteria bacterium]|nr:hypothetical protein [Candidatus Azambacteria bacterium]MBI2587936.1 hypothetical protein [Candidatus Azambacteria bacterium]